MPVLASSSLYTAWLFAFAAGRPVKHDHTILAAERDLLGLLGDAGPTETIINIPVITTSEALPEEPHITSSRSTVDTSPSTTPYRPSTSSESIVYDHERTSATLGPTLGNKESSVASNTPKASSVVLYPNPQATVTLPSSTYSLSYATAEAPTTPPGELTEWKVIGIAVITITFIGIVVLSVSFFDSWWGFVCAAVCGKRRNTPPRGLAGETLVPDWEKRSWEFRLANEDGHRYPTLASLESIVREKERAARVPGEAECDIKSPEAAYYGCV